jgi:ubiquinone/menaquinone biosynthesis C-methylase UbiE
LKHCRKPRGELGKEVLEEMYDHHVYLSKWGVAFFSIKPNFKIFDIGCGGGFTISLLASKIEDGKIFGIDYSPLSVKYSKQYCGALIEANKAEIKKASVSDLPFPDNYFDIVTGIETFYFWSNKINDLKEIRRVLKNDGTFALINEMYISGESEEIEKRNKEWTEKGEFEIYTVEEMMSFFQNADYRNIEIIEEKEKGWITILGKK